MTDKMIDEHSSLPHVYSERPTPEERTTTLADLVEALPHKREICPCCAHSILLELADESNRFWAMLNKEHTHMH
jgi:hypothetical protein